MQWLWLTIWWLLAQQPGIPAPWPCPAQGDIDGDGQAERIEQAGKGIFETIGMVSLPLPLPAVQRLCLADLDGDAKAELLVGVVRATEQDGRLRQRLFIYSGNPLQPWFLGTRGSGDLLDFGVADLDGDGRNEVLARERDATGEQTRVFHARGRGLLEDPELNARAPAYCPVRISLPTEIRFVLSPSSGPVAPTPLPTFTRTAGQIRPLVVKPRLDNVANRSKFSWLRGSARDHLVRHGFVILRPSVDLPEVHSLYIDNQYLGLPSFVTADAILHLAHLLFDQGVQDLERELLAPALKHLIDRLLLTAQAWSAQCPSEAAAALDSVLLTLQVADWLLSGQSKTEDPARVAKIKEIAGAIEHAATPETIDYRVRGHYAAHESLARYFRAHLFLSRQGWKDPQTQALLSAFVASDDLALRLLTERERIATVLVGPSGTCHISALLAKAGHAFGQRATWAQLAGRTTPWNECSEVTLLGRSWPADNDLLMAGSDIEARPLPSPLDLLATLGSARAFDWLRPETEKWPPLMGRLQRAAADLREGRLGDRSSLAGQWLLALRWLLVPYPDGYASFQRSAAWADHGLVSAASSWAELRHDTVLYVEPPIVWMEGGDEKQLPPSRTGYVEPLPELYQELGDAFSSLRVFLVAFSGEGFGAANRPGHRRGFIALLDESIQMLRFLEQTARIELAGRPLSREHHAMLSQIGSRFEEILADRGTLRADPVPVIAHVFSVGDPETGTQQRLQAATGPLDVIVAAVPIGNRIVLARGAVSSFYSIVETEPLTDEQWRRRLQRLPVPLPPAWAPQPKGRVADPKAPRSRPLRRQHAD